MSDTNGLNNLKYLHTTKKLIIPPSPHPLPGGNFRIKVFGFHPGDRFLAFLSMSRNPHGDKEDLMKFMKRALASFINFILKSPGVVDSFYHWTVLNRVTS